MINPEGAIGSRVWMQLDDENFRMKFLAEIIDVRPYDTLQEYLDGEDWRKVLPHKNIDSYQEAVNEYHKFYSDEEIRSSGGMVAIEIRLVDC